MNPNIKDIFIFLSTESDNLSNTLINNYLQINSTSL